MYNVFCCFKNSKAVRKMRNYFNTTLSKEHVIDKVNQTRKISYNNSPSNVAEICDRHLETMNIFYIFNMNRTLEIEEVAH